MVWRSSTLTITPAGDRQQRAGISAAPGSCAQPSRAVPPGLVAELSCQKIIFDLQLADLPVSIRFSSQSHYGCAEKVRGRLVGAKLELLVCR